ncbi:MAG: TIGR00270 family protein [Euryarchaeota archaeon]|nr:TIGR00270 family protein [Euryarchaeota archaeon]
MLECEICGKTVPNVRKATIEGTILNVCGDCARFGVEHVGPAMEVTRRSAVVEALRKRAQRGTSRDVYKEMVMELAPDYGERIRTARMAKGWSVEDLALRILEKKGVLAKVEHGLQPPSDDLARKLEKSLGITLFEKVEANLPTGKGSGNPNITLGDLIKRQLGKGGQEK